MTRFLSPHLSPAHSTTSSEGSATHDASTAAKGALAVIAGGGSGSSARNFKATQAASIAAVVESTSVYRNMIPGLAELMGGSSVGVMTIPYVKNAASAGGSGEVVAHTRIMNANTSGSGGDGDHKGSTLDSETSAAAAVHPSLPSMDDLFTAASRMVNECPPFMTMSVRDSAPQLKLEDPPAFEQNSSSCLRDATFQRRLVVKGGMEGYRMSRATHGAASGCYYYEAVILSTENADDDRAERGSKRLLQKTNDTSVRRMGKFAAAGNDKQLRKKHKPSAIMNGHLRIGWSTRLADLQAPVGYNEHSYAVRDTFGSRIHKSRREDKWGGSGFGPGDVVGVAICLVDNKPATTSTNAAASTTSSTGQMSSCKIDISKNSAENSQYSNALGGAFQTSTTLTNHIRFFKNGQPMGNDDGVAFNRIQPGTYCPAVSCYMDGAARLNFGPHFIYLPRGLPEEVSKNLHPISELCVPPPLPQETVEQVISGGSKEGKKIFSSKRTDDCIVSTFKELVKREATMRYEAFIAHLDLHRREILALRKARGISTFDLMNEV